MAKSDFVFESGEGVLVGSHGDHAYAFVSGSPLTDRGASTAVFESGVGIGGGGIIDSFEDGDMSEYGADYVQGSFNASIVEGAWATDRTHYLVSNNGGSGGARFSTTGLDVYPAAGDTFEWDFEHTGANPHLGSSGVLFGISGENTLYTALVCFVGGSQSGPNSPGIYLGKDHYLASDIAGTTYDFPANGKTNTQLTGRVEWGAGGAMTFKVFEGETELVSTSGSDSSYTSGGWGWHTDNTENDTNFDAYFDRAIIV